jgi:hypothetical protein
VIGYSDQPVVRTHSKSVILVVMARSIGFAAGREHLGELVGKLERARFSTGCYVGVKPGLSRKLDKG